MQVNRIHKQTANRQKTHYSNANTENEGRLEILVISTAADSVMNLMQFVLGFTPYVIFFSFILWRNDFAHLRLTVQPSVIMRAMNSYSSFRIISKADYDGPFLF